jgi:hypothetical protein
MAFAMGSGYGFSDTALRDGRTGRALPSTKNKRSIRAGFRYAAQPARGGRSENHPARPQP